MSNIIVFYFNGQKYSTVASMTIRDLLNYFNCKSILFIIEYNNYICSQKKWDKIEIIDNDKIELITIVGGG